MNQSNFIFFLLIFSFFTTQPLELVTVFNDNNDESGPNSIFTQCLEQNLSHFLITKIHVFYQSTSQDIPFIFTNPKIKIIPTKKATLDKIFKYIDSNLAGKKVIVANNDIFFDNSLFKLNYYPLNDNFMFLTTYEYNKKNDSWMINTNDYNCWVFLAPVNLNLDKTALNSKNCNAIIKNAVNKNEGLTITNPSLDVYSFRLNNNYNNLVIIPSAANINLPTSYTDFVNLTNFKLSWEHVKNNDRILLYACNMHLNNPAYCTPKQNPSAYNFACLSLNKNNSTHLLHDITKPIPLPDNSVDIYLSEDVFEHLDYNSLPTIINEIYRVLKPGGLFRLAMPDYRCDVLYNRSLKDINGKIIFDPQGGGEFVNGKVIKGGHLWFPTLESTKALLAKTFFNKPGKINYLHYYNTKNKSITNKIDYSLCYVRRTPDNDGRVQKPYRAMSIVIDLVK